MYFFLIPVSNVEVAAVNPNGAKTFFAKRTAIFINGPANLLNKDPKFRLNYFNNMCFRKL